MKRNVEKLRAWRRRGAEAYEARRRERDHKPLERRTELAPMSQRKLDELASKGETAPFSTIDRKAPKRRPPAEAENARGWHRYVCAGRLCVKTGEPAGPHGHHLVPQNFLKRLGLHAHLWDVDNGCPVTLAAHMNHESGADRITRAELQAAGIWERTVDWAKWIDAENFPDGHEPVLSRLLRDYPAINERS